MKLNKISKEDSEPNVQVTQNENKKEIKVGFWDKLLRKEYKQSKVSQISMKVLWFILGGLCVAAVVIYGLMHNLYASLGTGGGGSLLMLIGVIGDTALPSANKVAYFNKRTGKRTNSNGTPYYTGVGDYLFSSLATLAFGFVAGVFLYGMINIIIWMFANWNMLIVWLLSLIVTILSSFFRTKFYSKFWGYLFGVAVASTIILTLIIVIPWLWEALLKFKDGR